MIDRDRDADKLALVGAFGVLPLACSVLGCWMWPLFNSAGSSLHQDYKLVEILTGFVGGGVIGCILGGILLWLRAKTEQPAEDAHH